MSLSEQQLVDCETEDHGCDGGNTYNAFTYLIDHWAYLDSDWPYVAEDTKCTYDSSEAKESSGVILSTFVCVDPQSP